jgi:hypothetical protein
VLLANRPGKNIRPSDAALLNELLDTAFIVKRCGLS